MHPHTPAFHGRPFVLEFAGHLPNVTAIIFSFAGFEAFSSHPSSFVAISRFLKIQSLSMLRCTVPSFGALRRTLASLPSLTNLQLSRVSWPGAAAELLPHLSDDASTVRRPALSVLNIFSWDTDPSSRRHAQQLMAWLSETATSSSLVDLRIRVHNATSGGRIGCMATFGPSLFRFGRILRKLDIRVGESRDPDLELFLCNLTSLEALHLRFEFVLQRSTWVQMEMLVHSLPRPAQLVKLGIIVDFEGPPELSKFDGLEALDVALRPELFKGLQALMLHVEYRKDPEEGPALTGPMLAMIKSKLPELFARNIVEVSAYAFEPSDPPPVPDVKLRTEPNGAPS
ncbi:hypothetical protein OH76DRAFT_1400533 [Lentinus brumalis]|uniref:F-box domain-containing protein n=1 Tax=Lentinus brumalis TaxID=2498619 RepID=A0A371DI44_9APHY|nr:hypothetical protein OH76DRAFT_1400533 [Polyporus brumalis]